MDSAFRLREDAEEGACRKAKVNALKKAFSTRRHKFFFRKEERWAAQGILNIIPEEEKGSKEGPVIKKKKC